MREGKRLDPGRMSEIVREAIFHPDDPENIQIMNAIEGMEATRRVEKEREQQKINRRVEATKRRGYYSGYCFVVRKWGWELIIGTRWWGFSYWSEYKHPYGLQCPCIELRFGFGRVYHFPNGVPLR